MQEQKVGEAPIANETVTFELTLFQRGFRDIPSQIGYLLIGKGILEAKSKGVSLDTAPPAGYIAKLFSKPIMGDEETGRIIDAMPYVLFIVGRPLGLPKPPVHMGTESFVGIVKSVPIFIAVLCDDEGSTVVLDKGFTELAPKIKFIMDAVNYLVSTTQMPTAAARVVR